MTSCICPRCRGRALADVAPRLAKAQGELRRTREVAQSWLPKLRMMVHKAQWNVDHRDLQLARSFAVGDGRYIDRRRRKLQAAQRELAKLRRRLSAAERQAA